MRMSRGLAARLDRISRRAHLFHRFAHHPLCVAYAGEVVRLGSVRVCKGCLLTSAGIALGVPLALVSAPALGLRGSALLGTAVSLACAAIPLFGWQTPPKLLTRMLYAVGLVFTPVAALVASREDRGAAMLIGLAAIAMTVVRVARYRARGPNRAPCTTCAEKSEVRVCPGLRPIVARERAFARLSAILIAREVRDRQAPVV